MPVKAKFVLILTYLASILDSHSFQFGLHAGNTLAWIVPFVLPVLLTIVPLICCYFDL